MRASSFPQPRDAVRPSVWLAIDDPLFTSKFQTMFEEHIPGFGKVKRKRQPEAQMMEWKIRLEQKRARNKSGSAKRHAVDRSSNVASEFSC